MKKGPVASAAALKAALPAAAIVPQAVGSALLRTAASLPVSVAQARKMARAATRAVPRKVPERRGIASRSTLVHVNSLYDLAPDMAQFRITDACSFAIRPAATRGRDVSCERVCSAMLLALDTCRKTTDIYRNVTVAAIPILPVLLHFSDAPAQLGRIDS